MSARISVVMVALGVALALPAAASDVGYIYGRVETVGGESYQGELRWGTEEAFWEDIFNGDKVENTNLDYVSDRDLERVRSRHTGGLSIFGIGDPDLTHIFAARFGDLKRIDVGHGNRVKVEFRNGEELALRGGSNDIGARITVVDPKRGRQDIRWDRIRSIEFQDTPASLVDKLGEPLYGTVRAGRFDFIGRIQWDNDECLTIDTLDGETEDGTAHIPFGDIASIQKHRRGARVTLKSGEDLYITGTNDVNGENRGVVVVVPGIGSIKVGWDDFDEVTFRKAPDTGPSYAEFAKGRDLVGTVVTRRGRFDGRIVFDLDESLDLEILQGKNGDTEYLIPFRDIASIKPEGRNRASVALRKGGTIELEDGQDVSRKNDGLLVFAGGGEPTYIAWKDVQEVVFR